MEDIFLDAESHASKSSTDSSVGSDSSVSEDSNSFTNCTLEFNDVICGQSHEDLEENALSDFQNVQRMQCNERLYKDDIIQYREGEGLIGMVMRVSGDSDSDSEDEDGDEAIPDDCARIVWTNLLETTEKISDIEVIDRVFFHGDFVVAASDPSGQMGIVVNVDLTVDLLTPTSTSESIIKNVSSRNLHRIRTFLPDDYVIHGPWVGRIEEVVDNVTVIFDDGSKCKVMEADRDRLIPIPNNLHYPYFPGQRVRGSSSAVFKKARWLSGKWKKSLIEGTVGNVEVGSVEVHWFPEANPSYNSQSSTIPAELQQDLKQLKLLSYLSYANWQVGDWCLLPLPVTDDVVALAHTKDNVLDGPLFVCNKRTKVDVLWQDGTRTCGVNSTTLIPIYDFGDHEFFPEQYVLEKSTSDDDDNGEASEARRVGIVKSVDSKERTARVRWMMPIDSPKDALKFKFDVEKIVSVYELDEHPDYEHCFGDVVVRLSTVSESEETKVPGIVNHELLDQVETRPKVVVDTTDLSTDQKVLKANLSNSLQESDLSWIGVIIDIRDGDIEVAWANGMVSKVGPQPILVVTDTDEDDASIQNSVEEDGEPDDAASWETVDSNDGEHSHDAASWETVDSNDGEHDIAGSSETVDSNDGEHDIAASSETVDSNDGEHDIAASSETVDSNLAELIASKIDIKHTKEEDIVDSNCHEPCHSFKHFDSVNDPAGHYYQNETGQPINERKWMKKVQQEWNILEKNLPDSIFVRVYEDRMDLLRAVVVGAAGTPYQNGLFFFDIHLPFQYPDGPPLVYYHSGGLRLNPNLYENGKVCLSLLNTWTGKGNEVWNPTSSNLVQILVSIQGLVLNDKPYFNEPGYEKHNGSVEGEKNSLAYNESSFLLSCKSMLYILRSPPKHFEMFVKEHFQRRGYSILRACDAYMKGAQVGSLSEDCLLPSNFGAESTQNQSTSSTGFKLMLLKIVPKLISALSEIGVDCHEFEQSVSKESEGPRG